MSRKEKTRKPKRTTSPRKSNAKVAVLCQPFFPQPRLIFDAPDTRVTDDGYRKRIAEANISAWQGLSAEINAQYSDPRGGIEERMRCNGHVHAWKSWAQGTDVWANFCGDNPSYCKGLPGGCFVQEFGLRHPDRAKSPLPRAVNKAANVRKFLGALGYAVDSDTNEIVRMLQAALGGVGFLAYADVRRKTPAGQQPLYDQIFDQIPSLAALRMLFSHDAGMITRSWHCIGETLQRLPGFKGFKRAHDIGCGPGDLSRWLSALIPHIRFQCSDRREDIVRYAASDPRGSERLSFHVWDCQTAPSKDLERRDLLVLNRGLSLDFKMPGIDDYACPFESSAAKSYEKQMGDVPANLRALVHDGGWAVTVLDFSPICYLVWCRKMAGAGWSLRPDHCRFEAQMGAPVLVFRAESTVSAAGKAFDWLCPDLAKKKGGTLFIGQNEFSAYLHYVALAERKPIRRFDHHYDCGNTMRNEIGKWKRGYYWLKVATTNYLGLFLSFDGHDDQATFESSACSAFGSVGVMASWNEEELPLE